MKVHELRKILDDLQIKYDDAPIYIEGCDFCLGEAQEAKLDDDNCFVIYRYTEEERAELNGT